MRRLAALARRLRIRSLRGRLIAGMLALFTAACAIVGVATLLALRGFLVAQLDQRLAAAGDRYAVDLEYGGGERFGDVRGQAVGTFGARLVDGRVTQSGVVSDSDAPVRLPTTDQAALARLPADGRPREVDLRALGDYRVMAVRGRDGDVLVTGLPLAGVGAVLARLKTVELVVFGLVLAGSAATGAVFVRLALRPLRRVAATAMHVSELPLADGAVALPARVRGTADDTEVGQVSVAFDHMLEHIESALAQRQAGEERLRRFVADASHELRTPLAAIRGHAELARRAPGETSPAVEHALRRIESESARMGRLVDDMLLLARLDAGRPLAREPVDLTRLVIDAAGDARAAGPRHRWTLDLPEEPVVLYGDEFRLHQVVANLLANARTHTPPGTRVTVRVLAEDGLATDGARDGGLRAGAGGPRGAQNPGRPPRRAGPGGLPGPADDGGRADGGGAVLLEVIDDGPGIPPRLRADAFERFVRGDGSRSRKAGGTGLGLAIVSAVVQAHGGSVELDGGPPGTRVRIRLPRGGPDGGAPVAIVSR